VIAIHLLNYVECVILLMTTVIMTFYFVLTRDARWYDGENAMARRWSTIPSRHWVLTIVLLNHRIFSSSWYRTIAFSNKKSRLSKGKTVYNSARVCERMMFHLSLSLMNRLSQTMKGTKKSVVSKIGVRLWSILWLPSNRVFQRQMKLDDNNKEPIAV
jgi:hypothetical protein